MSELEEAWALALAEAEKRARAAGRTDISEYLALRSSNDLIRKTAGDWLLGIFAATAGEANRMGAAIQISTEDGHRFRVDNASMVGRRLSLGSGVRVLSVEIGWPRAPRETIRGGGRPAAISTPRLKSATEDLRLVLSAQGTNLIVEPGTTAHERRVAHHELNQFHEANVKKHVALC